MNTNITSLGLSIDGGYYCKINDGLYKVGYRLNLEKLSKYIRECIADKFGLDASQCLITESHFFRGRFRMAEAKKKNRLEGDRAFEDTLIENDVVFHYKHIAEMEDGRKRFDSPGSERRSDYPYRFGQNNKGGQRPA